MAGEAEVADVGAPSPCDEDVARLDVAMDETGLVRGVECGGDLFDERDGAFRFEAALLA